MIKILNKLETEGNYVNIIKVIYEKLLANIIHNSRMPKVFLLRSGTIQECSLSPLLLNIILKVLPRSMAGEWGEEH